jgi:hypothetical protein
MTQLAPSLLPIVSAPALAAALRMHDPARFALVEESWSSRDRLVPMYQVQGRTVEEEASAVGTAVSQLLERLRRLATAYGEWPVFDASAYFDLTVAQSAQLVKVVERVSTVHVVFFVDPLLPTLHQAADFWLTTFAPGYHAARQEPTLSEQFYQTTQPLMLEQWQRLIAVIGQARAQLSDDLSFWASNGAEEERQRWTRWWEQPPLPGLDRSLTPALSAVPTLTLAFDFPLPAHRQPGRIRRLRMNRDRRRSQRRRTGR